MQQQQQRQFNESKVEEIVVSIVSTVCQISLLVDFEDTPPFCAFDVNDSAPMVTKSGVTGWNSDVSIYYVHSDEQAATAKKSEILKALYKYNSNANCINVYNVVETFEDTYYTWRIDIQVIERF